MTKRAKSAKRESIRCPACYSRNVLFRKTNQDFWCRKCGREFKVTKAGKYRKVPTMSTK